jgi:hypothetical protein
MGGSRIAECEMEQIAATFSAASAPDDFHRRAAAIFQIMALTPFAAATGRCSRE